MPSLKAILKQTKPINQKLTTDLKSAHQLQDIKDLKIKYLGKKGLVNQLFTKIKNLPPTEAKEAFTKVNSLKSKISSLIKKHQAKLETTSSSKTFDVTIPGSQPPQGHLHLITQTIKEVEDIFSCLGFVRRRYQEIDTDWYAAEGLNIPKDHPARDDQETFYITNSLVLTPHTSNGQLREMERTKPPIKMINIAKTYRRQIDISHTPMFHQFEGLLIDKNINITHLIGISNYFAQKFFGPKRKIRLRPHHFQFTEPSFEVDITCQVCLGKGCRLCKAGWLELGGAGMVHPTVLKNGGINPQKYSGFAFGWGIERILIMKHQGLQDNRLVYTTDLRILNQF